MLLSLLMLFAVVPITVLAEQSGPAILTQPVPDDAVLGEKATIFVEAQGEGLTYAWYYKDAKAKSFTKSTIKSATYSLTLKETNANRVLYCVVTDAEGRKATTETVSLVHIDPLEITRQPVDGGAVLGKTASVSLEAAGFPLTYQWYFRDAGSKNFTRSSIRSSTYSITMTEARAEREVYCVVTDGLGNTVTSDTVRFHLLVNEELEILTQPVPDDAAPGEKATVQVEARGDALKYAWYYKDAGSKSFTKSTITSATYSLTVKESNANRVLYCVVTDAHGNQVQTDTVSLIHMDPLAITGQPADASAMLGKTVCVSVEATGFPLTYQWYFRDAGSKSFIRSSIKSNTYSLTMTEARANREVYCVVTDAFGNTVTSDIAVLSLQTRQTAYYPTLTDALKGTNACADAEGAAAEVVEESCSTTVTLLRDEAAAETLVIDTDLTLRLNGFAVTSTAFPVLAVEADAIIDGTVEGSSLLVTEGGAEICVVALEAGSCTINGGSYHTISTNAAVTVIKAAEGTALTVNDASVNAKDTANGVLVGIRTEAGATLTAANTKVLITTEKSLNNRGVYTEGPAVLTNCSAIAESDYRGANGAYTSNSAGIYAASDLELNNCTVWGTLAGVIAQGNVLVDGGTYSGYGHGAFYLSGEGTTSYFYNATLKWAKMRSGTTADSVAGTNNSAFYIGMANYITAYFDGCTFQANSSTNKSYCIVLRNSGGEHDNAVYVSNSSFSKYNKYAYRTNDVPTSRNLTAYSGVGNTYSGRVFQYTRNGRYTEDSYARP